MANAPTPNKAKKQGSSSGSNLFASLAIIICFILGYIVWKYIMGDPSHFEGGDPELGQPLPGDYFGMVYKAGLVVPVLLGLLTMTIVFSFERFFVISKASGKGNVDEFVTRIQGFLATGNIDAAIAECDKQKGSVANVIRTGLVKYKEASADTRVNPEQASIAIEKEIEEATALEMPMLEKNMTVIATLVSIGTLTGLLGTVTGMIKAFAALATGGAPDQAQLANGISEALVNTATGIFTSTIAVVMYNVFTSKIDKLTYSIDEAGYSIVQTYASTHNN